MKREEEIHKCQRQTRDHACPCFDVWCNKCCNARIPEDISLETVSLCLIRFSFLLPVELLLMDPELLCLIWLALLIAVELFFRDNFLRQRL